MPYECVTKQGVQEMITQKMRCKHIYPNMKSFQYYVYFHV